MNIQLGNLSLKDIVEEEHLPKIEAFLKENGFVRESVCEKVKEKEGNYHIYDIPRLISICGEAKMNQFIDFLKDNSLVQNAFVGRISITYESPLAP